MITQAGSSLNLAVTAAEPATDEGSIAAAARFRARRRKQLVLLGQVATLVLGVGTWELLSDLNVIDPFFFGSPLGIVLRLADWAVNGTRLLWLQIGSRSKKLCSASSSAS